MAALTLSSHFEATRDGLLKLPSLATSAFLLACAERLYPLYARYCALRGKPHESAVTEILDRFWTTLGTAAETLDADAIIESLFAYSPNEDDPDTLVETHADNFLIIVNNAARAVSKHPDYDDALREVFLPYLALLTNEEEAAGYVYDFAASYSEVLLALPIVVLEVSQQNVDLGTLRAEPFTQACETLRGRARSHRLKSVEEFE